MLYEWNDTAAGFPSDKCIHELFEEQVHRTPEAVAVVFEDAALSYEELNLRANQLAHYLRELGVVPDARVAICVERGFEMIVGLLAVLKAGGAYVPLDPSYPAERLHFMLKDSAPVALLAQSHLLELLPGLGNGLPIVELDSAALWQNQPHTDPHPVSIGLTPEHLAYVIYTSGSTGMPKGVMVQHRGLVNLTSAQAYIFRIDIDSRVLQWSSFNFDAFVSEVFVTFFHGSSLHIMKRGEVLAGEVLLQSIERHQITHVTLTPTAVGCVAGTN